MTIIKARDKTEEVRAHAGHSSNQWKQFMKITRQEAKRVCDNKPMSTWIDISDEEQNQVLEAVNLGLKSKNTPLVTAEILAWRMARAMGELRKLHQISSRAESSQAESQSNNTPVRKYWDPVKDDRAGK